MVVIAIGRAFDGGESFARVDGAVGGGVRYIDDVRISGIDAHAAEVVAASVDTRLVVDLPPAFAGIVGAVDAAFLFRIHPRVQTIGVAGRNGGADAADAVVFTGQSSGELAPVVAAVGGFVE